MSDIHGNLLRGHLEGMVLSVLERGEGHGYDILKRLQDLGNGALDLREGSLYPALYRMEEAGLVQAHWESDDSPRRGPRRRTYALTEKGRRQLKRSRETWRAFTGVVGRIMEEPT